MQKIKLFNKNNFYILKTEQIVNSKIEDVWDYFTNIKNLEKIMPKKYNTKVTIGRRRKIYIGKLFNIRMKILPFVHSNITSEIKAVEKTNILLTRKYLVHIKFGIMSITSLLMKMNQ